MTSVHPALAASFTRSVLAQSAGGRMLVSFFVIALLWLAVWWAVSLA